MEFLKGMSHYEGDEGKITIENVKIGEVTYFPDFDHPNELPDCCYDERGNDNKRRNYY